MESTAEGLARATTHEVPPGEGLKALMELCIELLATSCRVASQVYWELDTRSAKFHSMKVEADEAKKSYVELNAQSEGVCKENATLRALLDKSSGKLRRIEAKLEVAVKNMESYKALQLDHEKLLAELDTKEAKIKALEEESSTH